MANTNPDDLPDIGWSESFREKQRAGSASVQVRLQDRAWSMLETYRNRFGQLGSRLANEWLGAQGWRVQLVHQSLVGDPRCIPLLEALVLAARRRGTSTLLGTDVHPEHERPSAVWRVKVDSDSINGFFNSNYVFFHSFTMLFPENLGFAMHASGGDFVAFAGPEAFLREALPPDELGSRAAEELKADLEFEHGRGWLDGILDHYAPFMLDG